MPLACRVPVLFPAVLAALLAVAATGRPVSADTELRFVFAYATPGLDAPAPDLAVTDLLSDSPLEVVTPEPEAAGTTVLATTLAPGHFDGPYARMRVVVGGLELPPGDSKSGEPIRFAFELVLRRDRLEDGPVTIRIPVVTTSRRQAMKPYMTMPDLAEDLPDRFFLAQQRMALSQASPQSVAEAPQACALHRLISRAVADFAIETAKARRGAVLILPAPELAQALDLYWSSMPSGQRTHMAAFADARTMLWQDVPLVEDLLRKARRSGTQAPALCLTARAYLDYFQRRQPAPDEAGRVDAMFPVPGTLAGYLRGRQIDLDFTCNRLRI